MGHPMGLPHGRPSSCLFAWKRAGWAVLSPPLQEDTTWQGSDLTYPKSQIRSPALPLPTSPHTACRWLPPRGTGSLGPCACWESQSAPESSLNFCLMSK